MEISPDGVGRYPAEVEAAIYFSVLEGLQNIAKYADASHVEVRLGATETRVRFEVRDDGVGFDPSSTGYGTGLQGIADGFLRSRGPSMFEAPPDPGPSSPGSSRCRRCREQHHLRRERTDGGRDDRLAARERPESADRAA
ncbi:MAG: hypothetical protein M3P43_06345 [Actinomycetota bacterium]|nr:hypothetical protein [Actinomycetota bacterium]